VGECFFPDKGLLNGCVCVGVLVSKKVLIWLQDSSNSSFVSCVSYMYEYTVNVSKWILVKCIAGLSGYQ